MRFLVVGGCFVCCCVFALSLTCHGVTSIADCLERLTRCQSLLVASHYRCDVARCSRWKIRETVVTEWIYWSISIYLDDWQQFWSRGSFIRMKMKNLLEMFLVRSKLQYPFYYKTKRRSEPKWFFQSYFPAL